MLSRVTLAIDIAFVTKRDPASIEMNRGCTFIKAYFVTSASILALILDASRRCVPASTIHKIQAHPPIGSGARAHRG